MKTSAELRAELAEAERAERKAARIAGQRRSTVSIPIIASLAVMVIVGGVLTDAAVSENGWLSMGLFFAIATAASIFALVLASMDYGYRQCERDHDLIQSRR